MKADMSMYERFYREGKYCALTDEDTTISPQCNFEQVAFDNGYNDWFDFPVNANVPKGSLGY